MPAPSMPLGRGDQEIALLPKMANRQSAYEILQERPRQAQARQQAAETARTPAPRTIGSQTGRSLIRGVPGSLFGGRR